MKIELFLFYTITIVQSTLLDQPNRSQILIVQNTKDIKEIRYLKEVGESTTTEKSSASSIFAVKNDVEHPYCRMNTKNIFVEADPALLSPRGKLTTEIRILDLCKGLTYTCCSYNELKYLMDATRRRVLEVLADSLVDFTSLHRKLINYNHLIIRSYIEKKAPRVERCTGKKSESYMSFYYDIIKIMEEMDNDKHFIIIKLLNKYYKYLTVKAFEDNCRLCNPSENRYLFFNEQFLKFEIEFEVKQLFQQYYNRVFYDERILKLMLLFQSLECITSYNTDYINIDKSLELQRTTRVLIETNDYSQNIAALPKSYLQFKNFNPFSVKLIKFANITQMLESLTDSLIIDSGEFFAKIQTFEIYLKTLHPEFTSSNSIFNYNREIGFFSDESIEFIVTGKSEYVNALAAFESTTIMKIMSIAVILQLILF